MKRVTENVVTWVIKLNCAIGLRDILKGSVYCAHCMCNKCGRVDRLLYNVLRYLLNVLFILNEK